MKSHAFRSLHQGNGAGHTMFLMKIVLSNQIFLKSKSIQYIALGQKSIRRYNRKRFTPEEFLHQIEAHMILIKGEEPSYPGGLYCMAQKKKFI